MTVNTGISSSLLKPQTFHVLTFLRAGRALEPLAQRLCLIGIQSAAATATAGVVIPIDDPSQTDALFGLGSIMAIMARDAFATAALLGSGPRLFACPLAETTTKRVETLTFTGPATGDGDVVVRIAGRFVRVGIASGTSATNIGVAVDAAIQANYENIPYTSGNASGVVTLTAVVKGTLPNLDFYDVVSLPAGVGATFAQSVAGVGAVDMQSALDATAGQDFDGLAVCNHLSADVTECNTHLTTTWAPAEKKPRWIFMGEPGSIGTATGLSANHEGLLIISAEQSRSPSWEIATCAAVGALSKSRPNANYDGMILPIYPPPIAYDYTNGEIETALAAGLTPLQSVIDPVSRSVVEGQMRVIRLVTSRTTKNSLPFSLLRDFGTSRTAWFMAKQYDIAYANKFGSDAFPDGVLLDEDTEDLIRDMIISINKAAEDAKVLKNVDEDKTELVIEEDPNVSGRINVDVPYTIVVGLHQIAFVHRAQL